MPPVAIDQECWTMYLDESLMKKGTRVKLVFVFPLRVRMRYASPLSWASDGLMSEATHNWSSTRS